VWLGCIVSKYALIVSCALSCRFSERALTHPPDLNPHQGWLTAMIFVGMMLGSWSWGYAADVRGRKRALIWALIVNGVCGACSGAASDFWLLLLLRFGSGFG